MVHKPQVCPISYFLAFSLVWGSGTQRHIVPRLPSATVLSSRLSPSFRFVQAMLATPVNRFFSPGDIIFTADRDNKVVDVWKVALDAINCDLSVPYFRCALSNPDARAWYSATFLRCLCCNTANIATTVFWCSRT